MVDPVRITVEGEPVAKARPRRRNDGHVYTPSSDAENALAKILRNSGHAGRFGGVKSIAIALAFYCSPPQRGDLDNFVKLAIDALVKADVIPDDRYVTAIYAERHAASKNPKTVFYVAAR